MWPFKPKQGRFLGIDIGTFSIKVVELSFNQERFILENYAIYDAGKGRAIDHVIQTSSLKMLDDEVAETLRVLFETAKIQIRDVVFSIPVFSIFTTVMEFPFMPRREIDQAIKFEAKQYIPIPLNEVVYDWDFVGMSKFKDKKDENAYSKKLEKAQIILVAVPKEVINKYNNIARLAQVNLRGIESETFSLRRSVLGNDPSPACLVDAGSRNTNIAIIDKGGLMLNHNLDTSGSEFTKVIAQGMGIDMLRAEELKRSEGVKSYLPNSLNGDISASFKGEKEVAKILYPIVDIIVFEIDRIINIYQEKSGRGVDKIVLAGGSANMPGLVEYVSKKLNKLVVIGNPWSRIAYNNELDNILRLRGPSLAVAIGAAMRNL